HPGMTGAAALFLGLVAGVGLSSYFVLKANTRANRAEAEAKNTEAEARRTEAETRRAEAEARALAEQAARRAGAETARVREALARAEWQGYAGKLMRAQSAFADGNADLALQQLAECPRHLRGWEHRLLWTRFNARQTILGHTATISSA